MKSLCKLFCIIYILLAPLGISAQCNNLTNLTGSFDVLPGQDTCVEITLERLQNNIIGTNNRLEGIGLDFSHGNIGDLLVELTSPDGQTITLIGEITTGFPTNNSLWDVIFSECGGGASPDPGIVSEEWDNADNWTTFTNFTGIYYPNSGCFEDFNGGSLNGIWKLRILNNSAFETGTFSNVEFTLTDNTCIPCAADAGSHNLSTLTLCSNDDLILDFEIMGETSDPDYTLAYFVVSDGDGTYEVNLDNDFNSLTPGNYTICAFSISNDELITLINLDLSYNALLDGIADGSIPFCIDVADNCTQVTVNEGPPIRIINQTICEGDDFIVGSDMFSQEGTFPALLPAQGTDLCDTTVVLNLEVIDISPIIQPSVPEINCNNASVILDASNSLQESGSTFSWSTLDGIIDTDPNQITIEISAPGTYTLSQTEDECTRSTSILIQEATDVPQVSVSSDQLSCDSEMVTLELSITTASSAMWQGPAGFTSSEIEPSASVPGLYQGIITVGGCEVNVAYTLEQGSDQPEISAEAPSISCASPGSQVTISNLDYALYRWTGPAGFVSNIPEPVLPFTGLYFLEVQNMDGCKGYTSVEVFGNETTFEYEVEGQDFLCNGGRVTISATSEIPGSFFSWTGPNDYFSSSATNLVTAEGTYYVEIIANGCIVRDSVTLIRDISDLPEYDVSVENIGDCENPLWRLTAIPLANEFQTSLVRWGIPGVAVIGTGIQIDVSETGDYYLRVNTFNGCAVVERFTIEPLPASPIIDLTGRSNVTCTGGPTSGFIGVTENSDYTYNWTHRPNPDDTPSFIGDTSSLENIEAGFYSLTVTDINSGCVSFLETRVVGDTIPRTISLANTNINCAEPAARIVATVNGGGNSYEWMGPGGLLTTRNIEVTDPGEYVLTVIGGNGCISRDSVTIIADTDPPAFNLEDQELECATQSAELDPNTTDAGLLFSWSGPNEFTSTLAIPNVFSSGEYDVTITGLNGCVAQGSTVVSPNPDTPVPVAMSLDTLNCMNLEVQLTGSATTSVLSYFWNGPASFISDMQNPMVTQPGEYVLTIESAEGCIGFDTVQVVEEIILPVVSYAFDDEVDCIDISATLTGVTDDDGATFLWEGPNGFSSTQQNATALDTGTYIYYVRGSNNCVDSDTFSISTSVVNVNSSSIISCSEPVITVPELSDSISYVTEWTSPDGLQSTDPDFMPTEEGIYNGILVGSNGCTAVVSSSVTLDTLAPLANIEQLGEIRCELDSIMLSSNGSSAGPEFVYEWFSSEGLITSDSQLSSVDIEGVGAYNLTVIDTTNGCSSTTIISVLEEVQDFTEITLEGENPRCFGEDNGFIRFISESGGTAPYSFSLDGVNFTTDSIFGGLAPGTYEFTVKDSFGCIVTESYTIEETRALELDLGENIDIFLGNDVEINASTNLSMEQIESILWQIEDQFGCSDCLSFTLSPDENILIELTLTDERGCTITDEVKVRVDESPVLFQPTIFSPNQDGVNDFFFISANPGVASFRSLNIYDRWGEKVFSKLNLIPGEMMDGWDGNVSGNPVLPGVYAYILEVELITGTVRLVKGDVTLVR